MWIELAVNSLRNKNEKIELSDAITSLKNRIIELETNHTSLEKEKVSFVVIIKILECDSQEKNDDCMCLKQNELFAIKKSLELPKVY